MTRLFWYSSPRNNVSQERTASRGHDSIKRLSGRRATTQAIGSMDPGEIEGPQTRAPRVRLCDLRRSALPRSQMVWTELQILPAQRELRVIPTAALGRQSSISSTIFRGELRKRMVKTTSSNQQSRMNLHETQTELDDFAKCSPPISRK